jgi:hypothetical protein
MGLKGYRLWVMVNLIQNAAPTRASKGKNGGLVSLLHFLFG